MCIYEFMYIYIYVCVYKYIFIYEDLLFPPSCKRCAARTTWHG